MLKYPAIASVCRIAQCDLRVSRRTWDFASANSTSIEENWCAAVSSNPGFFNGAIHLIEDLQLDDQQLTASLLRTDFKSFLFWRSKDFPETGVLDGFGSALIRSADGAILLGRQRTGNVNGGLAYLPGGFIDGSDADGDGRIDIAASIARELREETGLTLPSVQLQTGFLVTRTGPQVSIAVTFQSGHDADALKASIRHHIDRDPKSELTEIVIVRGRADLEGLAMPAYARVLLNWVLAHPGGRYCS